jgi:hypothetical protein
MSFWNGTEWVSETAEVAEAPPAPERPSHMKRLAGAAAEGALIAALTFGLIAGSAFAAKGGRTATGDGTLAGPVMVADADSDGAVSSGDDINFDFSTTASKAQIGLRCYQGETFVYDGYVATFDSWLSAKYFTLSSSYWDSTAEATCTARLFRYDRRAREQLLAPTLSFTVAP